jgi:hypothetical protein
MAIPLTSPERVGYPESPFTSQRLIDDAGYPYGVKQTGNRPHVLTYVYDPVLMDYVVMTQPVIDAGDVNIAGPVTIAEDNKAFVLYQDGTDLYFCQAVIGSALNAAVWQIQKIATASGARGLWCDGNASYDNLATNLATVQGHSYS